MDVLHSFSYLEETPFTRGVEIAVLLGKTCKQ